VGSRRQEGKPCALRAGGLIAPGLSSVTPGLVPGIRVFAFRAAEQVVDRRDEPGHIEAIARPAQDDGCRYRA